MATCKACSGKGFIKCPTCRGSGRIVPAIEPVYTCKNCEGSGIVKCGACKGKGTV
jgi:DnaJ-class molecular chaperone